MQIKSNLKMDAENGSESFQIRKSEKRKDGPDQGWAWAVAIASFVINLIMSGLNRISGILFVAFIEIFEVDRQRASMPFSVRSSAGNLFGPIVGILGQKYGARKVITAGAVIGGVSSAACFFTPNITWITILWGGISGVGATLAVTLPQVVIGQYFDIYKTTASGIAFSGGCVGSFVFPVILEYFLHNYGIEGTFLVVGAIILNTVPAGLILRNPSWLGNKVKNFNDTTNLTETMNLSLKEDDDDVFESTAVENKNSVCVPEFFTFDTPKRDNLPTSATDYASMTVSVRSISECNPKASTPTAMTTSGIYPDVELMQKNYELVTKILNFKPSDGNLDLNGDTSNKHQIMAEIENMCNSLRKFRKVSYSKNLSNVKKNLFGSEKDYLKVPCNNSSQSFSVDEKTNIANLSFNQYYRLYILNKLSDLGQVEDELLSACDDKTKTSLLITELQKLHKLYPRITVTESQAPLSVSLMSDSEFGEDCDSHSNTFCEHIKTAFLLYLNPLFLMVCLCRAIHFIAFIPAMTTVVDFCMDKGLKEDEGKFAIIAISIGDMFGRLCFGWVTDRGFITLPKYMMTVMIMQGMSTASLPMMNSEFAIFSLLALFGLLQGSLFVRHPVLISNYMQPHEQSISMGSVNFLSGILGFGLPAYIGFFRDTLGSYSYIFYINGALGAVVGLLWAFEPCFVRFMNSKRRTQIMIA